MPVVNSKTKDEIIVRIITALQQNANITAVSPGSVARAFADAFGTEMFYLYEAFREAVNQTNLSTASGRSLDMIGELYNVRRKTISDQLIYERSTANIEFFINTPYQSSIIIPKGTLVFNDVNSYSSSQYTYKVAQDIVILNGSTRAYGIVEPNFQSNDYVASVGTLTRHNYISPPGVIVFCNNPKEIYPILNSESDDNYRRRILSAIKVNSTGTLEAIRFAALSVSGVRDIRIREATYGLGSCEIIIVPEVAGRVRNLVALVNDAISNVRPLGIRMNTRIADVVTFDVNATISLPYGTAVTMQKAIQNQAAVFVSRYLNSLSIGDSASIQEVERQIKISSDMIRSVNVTSVSAGGVNINRKDFMPPGERQYVVAGAININSVIMGVSNY